MAEKARIGLVGFRWDENSSFLRGAADAPPLIRRAFASESANHWSERGVEITPGDFLDAGDFGPGPGIDMPSAIEGAVGKLLDMNLRVLSLGGDHAVTYPDPAGVRAQVPEALDPPLRRASGHLRRVRGQPLLARLPLRADHGGEARPAPRPGGHPHGDRAPAGADRAIRRRVDRDEGLPRRPRPRVRRAGLRLVRHRRPRSGVCARRVALGAGRPLDAPGARRDRAREGADRRRRRRGVQSEGRLLGPDGDGLREARQGARGKDAGGGA